MEDMFAGCKTFNQPLNRWIFNRYGFDEMEMMEYMFYGCNIIKEYIPRTSKFQVIYLKYKDLSQEERDENKTCPITTEEYNDDTNLIKTDCRHIFSKEAFETWAHSHNTCPMCRSRFTL